MGYGMFMLRRPEGNFGRYRPQFEDQPEYWRFNSAGMAGMTAG